MPQYEVPQTWWNTLMERLGFSDPDPSQLVNPAGALGSVLKKGQVPLITKAVRLFDKPVSKNELEALEKAIPPGGKVERLLKRWSVEYPPSRLMPESFRHSQEEGRYYHNIPEHKEPLRRRLVTTQHHLYAGGSPLSRKRTPKHLCPAIRSFSRPGRAGKMYLPI